MQTYYLTVELSYPEFKSAAPPNPHHSRGGYYKKWLTQPQDATESAAARSYSRVPNLPRPDDNDDNDEEPVPGAEEDMLDIDPNLRADAGMEADGGTGRAPEGDTAQPGQDNQREEEDEAEQSEPEDLTPLQDIQILDLHSRRPIISYRGRVFEGQWGEMIGTDLILARHDPNSQSQLPALRNLPGDVDILAASASRILTTEKILEPRVPEEDTLEPIRKEWNINIPVGKHKSGERAQQADFLEKLIALKIKKGEEDKVTVYARDGEGKHFQDDKDPSYRPRRKRISGHYEDGEEGESWRKRRRSGRPPGRPRKTVSETSRPISHEETDPGALSVPTPVRWADLEGGDRRGGELEDIDENEEGEQEEEEEEDLSSEGDDDEGESDESADDEEDEIEDENADDDEDDIDDDEDSGEEGDTVMTRD